MNQEDNSGGEISLLELATVLVQGRRTIVLWTLVGAVLSALFVVARPTVYKASTSFYPQASDAGRSALASVAGQLGFALPSGSQFLTSEFYNKLLRTQVVLAPIASDTFVVHEMGDERRSFMDLFGVPEGPSDVRLGRGVKLLSSLVVSSVGKTTGIVEISVLTHWPSVSLALATKLVDGVNDYNRRTRRSQASGERVFFESRLAEAGRNLRVAEDRMQQFFDSNKRIEGSPGLTFERGRLERELTLRSQLFSMLSTSYEDVRVREVRDIPVIGTFEPPMVLAQPEPRGRLKAVLFGMLFAGFLAAATLLVRVAIRRSLSGGGGEIRGLLEALGEARQDLIRAVERARYWLARPANGTGPRG